ncbi:hypothetical protein RvY_07332 [Ramazzottius varieornatus]|uniref:RING-type domain-containing protein n=1 Tax=Ramazzottius varieornatus TaxID=947166 RepID=A0A1D1V1Z3_RAMVA|nr:hypothetical protein RvY_07332 [Ramazzottius varieornatus]
MTYNPTLMFNNTIANDAGTNAYRGVVSMFHSAKGYGFINVSPDDDPYGLIPLGRIFFHVTSVNPRMTNSQVKHQLLDKNVQFSVGLSPRNGRQIAENVRLDRTQNTTPVIPLTHIRMSVICGSPRPEPPQLTPQQAMANLTTAFGAGLNVTPTDKIISDLPDKYEEFSQSAIEMGFPLNLVVRAAHAHKDPEATRRNDNHPVIFETLEDFLAHLCAIQDSDDFDAGKHVFSVPKNSSDDYRFGSWMTEAESMGFDYELVLEAFALNGSFESFQDLIEKVLTMETKKDNDKPKKPAAILAQPLSPVESNETKLRKLRRENQDLRDFFQCKVCFSADSTLGFYPCGHLCCCVGCGQSQATCPYCRQAAANKFFRVASANDRAIPPPRDDDFKTEVHEEIRILSRENREIEILRNCVVCRIRDRGTHFSPCGHVVACVACARACTDCPACLEPIGQRVAVFFA